MNKILPTIFLTLSVISLGLSIFILIGGSKKSQLYNQMKETSVVKNYNELVDFKNRPFLLQGYIKADHSTKNDMVAYVQIKDDIIINSYTPSLQIALNGGVIDLKMGYSLADYNTEKIINNIVHKGILPGRDVSIYCVLYNTDDFNGIKGYELYPGTIKQYLEFLKSPHIYYMIYVRFLIAIALILFICSLVINIKK